MQVKYKITFLCFHGPLSAAGTCRYLSDFFFSLVTISEVNYCLHMQAYAYHLIFHLSECIGDLSYCCLSVHRN